MSLHDFFILENEAYFNELHHLYVLVLTLCFFVIKPECFLNPTVILHYFHWPTLQPEMHTKIALRLQSSSHLGDTNGMIDTNVSRANCRADFYGSDRALYLSNHLA